MGDTVKKVTIEQIQALGYECSDIIQIGAGEGKRIVTELRNEDGLSSSFCFVLCIGKDRRGFSFIWPESYSNTIKRPAHEITLK